jgi:hypothetical protein
MATNNTAKKAADGKASYRVTSPIKDGDTLYAEGDTIELTDKAAKELIDAGAVEANKASTAAEAT